VKFNYVFSGLLEKNTTDPPNIAMPDNYLNWKSCPEQFRKWMGRFTAQYFWSFKYILFNTSARWIWCGDDDILINFELLPRYARRLARLYDPLRDFVVRGECIKYGVVYPQGGSGIVFSRRAIEMMEPFANFSIWGFWEKYPDRRVGVVIGKVHRDVGSCASSAFLGSFLPRGNFSMLKTGNFSGLEPCPPSQHGRECRVGSAPVNQVVFFHIGTVFENGPGFLKERLEYAKNLWSAPSDVWYWAPSPEAKALCRGPSQDNFPFIRV
jgi:hypothetical protein